MTDDAQPQAIEEMGQLDAPEVETEGLAQASESATDSADEREQNTSEQASSQEEPESYTKRINKMHWEKMEAKREAERLQKELEELKSKSSQQTVELKDVPPVPDQWDDDFEAKMKARDAIIANNVKAQAQREAEARAQEARMAQQEQEAYERSVKLQGDFNSKAKAAGINEHSLIEAQKLLVNNGLSGEKAYAVLTDDRGPQIAMYLAENPMELQTLLTMSTIDAVRHIDRNISAKLASTKPKSSAPPPPDTLSGKSAVNQDWFSKAHPNAVIE